jgi:hypothetical protein
MTHLRNGIIGGIFLLAWVFFYVPNPYLSLHGNLASAPGSNDVLFFWIPSVLAIAAYIAHKGHWFIRFLLALAPPLFILGTLFLLGTAGVISNESAGWGLIFLMLPLRAFVIALAATLLLVESFERYRKGKRDNRGLTPKGKEEPGV